MILQQPVPNDSHSQSSHVFRKVDAQEEGYAMEELRAELFSVACAEVFGLEYPRERQTNYMAYWSGRIREGQSQAILKAANEVDTVLSAILDAAEGKQPRPSWFPAIDFMDFPTPLKACLEMNQVYGDSGVDVEGMANLDICRAILPGVQFTALEQEIIGPKADAVCEAMREIVECARALPGLYAQEPFGQDATAYMRVAGTDGAVYLTELDIQGDCACGYSVNSAGESTFGEIPLDTIRSMNGTVDTAFLPAPVAEIARRYEPTPGEIALGDDEEYMSLSM